MNSNQLHQHHFLSMLRGWDASTQPKQDDAGILKEQINKLVDDCMQSGEVFAFGDTITLADAMGELEGRQDSPALKLLNPSTYSEGKEELENLLRIEIYSLIEMAFYEQQDNINSDQIGSAA